MRKEFRHSLWTFRPTTQTEYRCDKPPCGFIINVQDKIVLSVSYSGLSLRSCVNIRKYLDTANRYLTTEVRTGSTACITSTQFLSPHLLDLMFFTFSSHLPLTACVSTHVCIFIYRVSQEECARLREGVPYVRVYRYNPKHLCPKLNGYGDKGARKLWCSCGSTYCTWFAWRNTHTLRIVRPCLQPA